MSCMKRSKIVKMWSELGDERPSLGDFENYMNRPMSRGPYGFVRCGDILDYFMRGEFWWMYLDVRRRQCSKRVARLKAAERRPKYYAAENERRRALAAERQRVRARTTTSPCPTREAVLEAWRRRRDSHEAAVRFGSMLEDLECYLDNSLRRDENGVIVGRNPGIKGWFRDNLPELLDKYTTAMRYKAAAKKLKQIVELTDPTPAAVVLPSDGAVLDDAAKPDDGANTMTAGATQQSDADAVAADATQPARDDTGKAKQDYGADEITRGNKREAETGRGGDEVSELAVVPGLAVVRARAIWGEIVGGIGRSATALMARIDALTDPERVEDANMLAGWREKYKNEITERTKKRWWRRLLKSAREMARRGKEVEVKVKEKDKVKDKAARGRAA